MAVVVALPDAFACEAQTVVAESTLRGVIVDWRRLWDIICLDCKRPIRHRPIRSYSLRPRGNPTESRPSTPLSTRSSISTLRTGCWRAVVHDGLLLSAVASRARLGQTPRCSA